MEYVLPIIKIVLLLLANVLLVKFLVKDVRMAIKKKPKKIKASFLNICIAIIPAIIYKLIDVIESIVIDFN